MMTNIAQHFGRLGFALVFVALMTSSAHAEDTRVFRASDRGKPGVPSLSSKDLTQLKKALASVKPADKVNLWFGFFTDSGRKTFIIFNTRGFPVEGSEPYGEMFKVLNDGCNVMYVPHNHDIEVFPNCMQ